jgi:hypothetical protein
MRRILPSIVLFLLAGHARAEDFTGFYAGVNAGYGWSRERDRSPAAAGTNPTAGPRDAGSDLPPSAQDAAASLRRSGRIGSDATPGR